MRCRAQQADVGEWNCNHFAFDIVLGISKRLHSDEELEEWRKANSEGCTIDGEHYTNYEAKKLMRQLETKIRRQKDVAVTAKASGDDVLRRQAQSKITQYTEVYKRVADASGFQTRFERTRVEGFNSVKLAKMQEALDVSYPEVKGVIPKGTAIQNERVIAGLGSEKPIRDIDYLVNEFGGSDLQWSKVGGIITTDYFRYDVHWYEMQGKQFKMKLKGVKEIELDWKA